MMNEQPKDEIPGYVTTENYDIQRKKLIKAEDTLVAQALRIKDLEKDLQESLFIRAQNMSHSDSIDILGKPNIKDTAFEMLKAKGEHIRVRRKEDKRIYVEVIE